MMLRIFSRRWIFLFLVPALLVGCSKEPYESEPSPVSSSEPEAAGAEVEEGLGEEELLERLELLECAADRLDIPDGPTGGTFRFNIQETPRSLDPAWIGDTASSFVGFSLHEGLVTFDPIDTSVQPCIAESWDISEDGLEYTFHLREGVLFHDNACFPDGKGSAVVASDFKYSFERVCDPRVASVGAWMFIGFIDGASAYRDGVSARREVERRAKGEVREAGGGDRFRAADDAQLSEWASAADEVTGIRCPDDRTLVIRLEQAFSPFLLRLGHSFGWVVPREAVEKYGDDFFKNPVGAGPFRFVEWVSAQLIVLEKHAGYWMKDEAGNPLPYLDRIEMTQVNDANSEHLELLSGHLHFQFPIPLDQWDSVFDLDLRLRPDYERFQVQWADTWRIEYIGLLCTDPVFKDKRVRQAFNHMVDREEIASTIYRYRAIPNHGMVVPGSMPDYETEDGPYKYDPEKAKALLAEAGYADLAKFPKLTLQLNSAGRDNEKVAEVMQGYFAQAGIDVSLQVVDWRIHLDTVREGKVPFFRMGWLNDYPSPENSLMLLDGQNLPPVGENYARYTNPEFDRLYREALAAVDPVEQNRLFREAEKVAVDDAAWLFLFTMRQFRLVAPEVRGFPMNAGDRRYLKYTWLEQGP